MPAANRVAVDARQRFLSAARRHAVRMSGERRLRRETHRIAIHVVAQRDDIGERDRPLGVERVVVRASDAARRRRAARSPPPHSARHGDRPAEALRARRRRSTLPPSISPSSAICSALRVAVPLSDVRTISVVEPGARRRFLARRRRARTRRRARAARRACAARESERRAPCDRRARPLPRARTPASRAGGSACGDVRSRQRAAARARRAVEQLAHALGDRAADDGLDVGR